MATRVPISVSRFDKITAEIRNTTPGVLIQSGWRPDHAIVRLEPLARDIYPLTLNCYPRPAEINIEEYSIVARLLFGGMALPQQQNIVYSDRPKEHAKREYQFRLSPTNQWRWLDPVTSSLVSSDELANQLIAELLQLYDDVESGKVALPSFW